MSDNINTSHNLLSTEPSRGFWKAFTFLCISLVTLTIILCAGIYVWAQGYEGKIPPNVFIGEMALGGLDPEQARMLLQEQIDEIVTGGLVIQVDGEEKSLSLVTLISSDLREDVEFFLDETLETLMALHGPTAHGDALQMLQMSFEPVHTGLLVSMEENLVQDRILELFPEAENLSVSAQFVPTLTSEGWSMNVRQGEPGREFIWEPFFETLAQQLTVLDTAAIKIDLKEQEPKVSVDNAESQIETALAALLHAPVQITFTEEGYTWWLTADQLSDMLLPGEDGLLALDNDLVEQWTLQITDAINKDYVDARLELTDGRVSDFVQSEEGRKVNVDILKEDLLGLIREPVEQAIELSLNLERPTVTTGDVNDLGITEILGTGTSSYRWSPWNRQQNIQNGVTLLNGLLIAPGETFSLIDALSPFTAENGYLPELVIKGDKIEPEMGGGLCQIGTTTFRATMNAGLSVTERRNHSLVVSYYNDPSNGLPGTDATIYEPAPDYKFTNDTDSYVLFQAENLTETQDLRFTFWGTSDGRRGSYEPPVVSRWIPVGETQYIETEDLEPGEEECQEAHIGADASFIYTVARTDGEIDETEFTSHYRPLPKICLLGIDPDAEIIEDEDQIEDEDDQLTEVE
jgi:vancomycin resistance protein YoaR